MFIGREYELNTLNKLYNEDKFHFIVMYGRRRVGKTTLLTEFCKDKPSIFFVAEEYNDKIALESFSDKILSYFGLNEMVSRFESWEKAFLFLGQKAKNERLVLVIDEFPYIVNSNKSIPSILQNLIDHYLKDTKLFLIICGSSMSFIEKEVLSYKSPLYGRRTSQLIVEPFDFFDSRKFFPNYSFEEQVIAYGVLGGIPQYLSIFDDKYNVYENIKTKILDKSSYLYEEPKLLLRQEVREPALYNSIIEAIATGSSKLNEISTKVSVDTDKCSKYISTLIDLKILERITPVELKAKSRKSIYKIKDNFFRFWYRFIFNNKAFIEQGLLDEVIESKIKPSMNDFLGLVYEEICTDYLKILNKNKKLPFIFEEIGKWWGNNPYKKREEEIDIVAINNDNIIFGECKWQNQKIDMAVLNDLIEKSALFDYPNKYYILFSKSGFTSEVANFASYSNNIILIESFD
ncbi:MULTISPECIES: ATP-binding protein [Thermoanaerobacterium]|uniref:ATPase n=2 Tax=Thermoanaerobacterium TaxID=28895 RepID=W9EIZ9_9THEO|nr:MULTISPECIES: ATP-binding protein [Thermoanaerobacterium]AFK85614.1 ATPase [Thermoanaerobacterium saccharolyticum JW/SL-YS485]ETO39669.1 ATPase [Thermoanaerobacterium aotearoense SCUT27]